MPQRYRFILILAEALRLLSRDEEAITYATMALKLNPNNLNALYT